MLLVTMHLMNSDTDGCDDAGLQIELNDELWSGNGRVF